jgi:hypothetical protein
MNRQDVAAGRGCGHGASADVRKTLSYLMPQLEQFWTRPLKDYAFAAYDAQSSRNGCYSRDEAMLRLQKSVEEVALRSGANQEEAKQASGQLAASPIIQSGPHCHLLIEPDAFYTHLFSLLGLNAHGLRWHICYSASTVKFIEKPKKGPGWLRLEDDAVNVFGLPRSRMDSYNICGFNGPYRFMLSGRERGKPANDSAARLMTIVPGAEFPSAAEAIKAANRAIWEKAFPALVRLLQLDDIDVADLLAEHLEDPGSWLSTRFAGNGLLWQAMLQALDDLDAGPWAGWIRRTTDFFWGLAKGRILPLKLKGGMLSNGFEPRLEIPFSRLDIADALRRREIVPNLLMTFLVTSILPGVRVLGGCRQTVYYPLMRHVVASALEKSGEQELLNALKTDVLPGLWGHRVLKPDDGYPFLEIERNKNLFGLLAHYGDLPLANACGDLASFTSDPVWAALSAHIAGGTAHAQSPEWRWP